MDKFLIINMYLTAVIALSMRLAQPIAAALLAYALHCPPAHGSGEEIFLTKCVACHAGGGNALAPGKTLDAAALERNGYLEAADIVTLLRNGKGRMPQYQGKIPPVSRLSDEQLEQIAQYVLEHSQTATWPSG